MNDKEHPESKAHDDPPPREIARDIAHTRAQMSETLAEIEQRLNPTELREKAVEELHVVEVKVKEAVKEQFEEAKAKVKVRGLSSQCPMPPNCRLILRQFQLATLFLRIFPWLRWRPLR